MKPAVILALPTLALAAVAPKLEKRQPDLSARAVDLECLRAIPGITDCVQGPIDLNTVLSDLLGCPAGVVTAAIICGLT
ncbi:hypothetical protein F66182_9011 [Fusarium sp. NRRL 66182]|nr:hypothetical protein F66182_9011 [Fusarium sp. NRRL 66182]